MPTLTDLMRVKIATAYAEGNLAELYDIALSAVLDYETARNAYDALVYDMQQRYGGAA